MKLIPIILLTSLLRTPVVGFIQLPRLVESNITNVEYPEISQAFYGELEKCELHDYRAGFATQKELVWMGRITVIGILRLAYYFAMDPASSVLDLVTYAWSRVRCGIWTSHYILPVLQEGDKKYSPRRDDLRRCHGNSVETVVRRNF